MLGFCPVGDDAGEGSLCGGVPVCVFGRDVEGGEGYAGEGSLIGLLLSHPEAAVQVLVVLLADFLESPPSPIHSTPQDALELDVMSCGPAQELLSFLCWSQRVLGDTEPHEAFNGFHSCFILLL